MWPSIGNSTKAAPGIRRARSLPRSTSTQRSRVLCRTSVGTRMAGRTLRMSIWMFIRSSASNAPGLALWRTHPRQRARPPRASPSASRSAPSLRRAPTARRRDSSAIERTRSCLRRPPRIVRRTQLPRLPAVEDERPCALGIGRREERAHRDALGRADERRALGAGGVHDRAHVVHPRLERRERRRRGRRGRCRACRSGSAVRTTQAARGTRA